MSTSKSYEQVIEWEDIDTLTSNNVELAIGILLFIVDNLTDREKYSSLYKFSVIAYGWLGYYPAIGVEFMTKDSSHLDEDNLFNEFREIVKNSNLLDFINFTQKKHLEITTIYEKIFNQNKENNLGNIHE